MSSEKINHPPHYGGDTRYEAIKVIEAWKLSFCLGNAVKYICRAGKKGRRKNLLEDLKKARWYLDRQIELMEKQDERARKKTSTLSQRLRRESKTSGEAVGQTPSFHQ